MPTHRTDALHTAWNRIGSRRSMHHCRPSVQETPFLQWDGGGGIIIVTCGVVTTCRDTGAVSIFRSPQVLFHPALVADFHSVVDVAVHICYRGKAGAGTRRFERDFFAIDCSTPIGGVCTHIIGDTRDEVGELTAECIRFCFVDGGMRIIGGRVVARAPAYTADNVGGITPSHIQYFAATGCRCGA